ncbi:unnamed protein product [Pleuronectes platessa]|uniref:Secreted protein n=1 Tax=Pleuronectes platessa TaxID=8262 RepID=A0A9N7Y1T5_PLEPL|nr:unnamed protein product [Pleuronectes platessa]
MSCHKLVCLLAVYLDHFIPGAAGGAWTRRPCPLGSAQSAASGRGLQLHVREIPSSSLACGSQLSAQHPPSTRVHRQIGDFLRTCSEFCRSVSCSCSCGDLQLEGAAEQSTELAADPSRGLLFSLLMNHPLDLCQSGVTDG